MHAREGDACRGIRITTNTSVGAHGTQTESSGAARAFCQASGGKKGDLAASRSTSSINQSVSQTGDADSITGPVNKAKRKLFYLWRANTSGVSACAPSNRQRWAEKTHTDTHAFTNTLWQMLKCIVSAWATLTSVYAVLNVQHFLCFLPKWIEGWISEQEPGPFTGDWCVSIWCVKIIYINPPGRQCPLKTVGISRTSTTHTHTRDS